VRILLLIVLAVITLFFELPQGQNLIHRSSLLTVTLAGIFLIRLGTRPRRHELFLDGALAAVIVLATVAACHNGSELFLSVAASLGLASLVGLGIRRPREPGERGVWNPFAAAAVLLSFSLVTGFFQLATVGAAPKTFDTYLYAFDCSFGTPGSFLLGRVFASWPTLNSLSTLAYCLLPTVLAAFCGLQFANPKLSPSNIMTQFAVAAAIGWILYLAYPAIGPRYAFPGAYPASPPLPSAMLIDFVHPLSDAPRNCMPSLHAAWALLLVSNSRPFGSCVRFLACAFLLLTLLATLGLGEHYLVDLVVAVPFALGIRAYCATSLPRSQCERLAAGAAGGILTAAWILALRQKAFVVGIPVLASWALVALTVGICLYLERHLSMRLYGGPSSHVRQIPHSR
jgi:hypothetical protein